MTYNIESTYSKCTKNFKNHRIVGHNTIEVRKPSARIAAVGRKFKHSSAFTKDA